MVFQGEGPLKSQGESPDWPALPTELSQDLRRRLGAGARGPAGAGPGRELCPGEVVGGFRLVSLLGQGGMGQVWEAAQTTLGDRRVAVKFVRPDRVSEEQLRFFAREARAGGRLSHPGLVTVHASGETDGLGWIAMELVEGAWTLRDHLDAMGREDEVPAGYDGEVARLVAEIAEAMQAAHDAGVIHRDLKPQNILVGPDNRPKVSDFGLARLTDESAISQTGEFAGTYFYMSPEQVTARRMGLDHRTDVFSLGVVMYELLTLQRPFRGDTTHQVAEQIVTKDPPDPRTIRSRVPRDLAVIAGRAMAKDRDKRFQSMGEMAADLRRFLANEPIVSRPPGPLERVGKWIRRHPTVTAAAVLGSVAVIAISALLAANLRANRELRTSNERLSKVNQELFEANAALRAEQRMVEGMTRSFLESVSSADGPRILPRSEWTDRAPIQEQLVPMGEITRITIHHSAGEEGSIREPERFLEILHSVQDAHMDVSGWYDIGYHFAVAIDGRTWECRSLAAQGSHAGGANNVGNVGILVLGDYSQHHPTPQQMVSIQLLVRWLREQHGIPHDQVFVHSDFKDTSCPGANLLALLRGTLLSDARVRPVESGASNGR